MREAQSPAIEDHGKYKAVKPYQLPLRVKDGGIGIFELTYFEFPGGRYHALSQGDLQNAENVSVRINSECMWGRFGSAQCDCNEQFEESKKIIDEEGLGLIVFAHDQIGKDVGLKAHAVINSEANLRRGEKELYEVDIWAEPFREYGGRVDYRDFTDAAEIIKHLGIKSVELMTNNPAKIKAMEENGVRIVKRRPLVVPRTEFNELELQIKKEKGGHLL